MTRPGRPSVFAVWVTLASCAVLSTAAGCGRGVQPLAQNTSETERSSGPSSQPDAPAATEPMPVIGIGDYENDPDYTPYTEHYTDGRIKVEGGFRDGKRHGVWTYYRAFNGNIMRVERYRDGELFSME